MRRLFFLLFLFFIAFSCYAQKLPDWMNEKPTPKNETYLYMREAGLGEDETKACFAAISRVINMTRLRLGQDYNLDTIKQVLDNNKMDYSKAKEIIFELTKGQVSVQDGFYDKTEKKYWVLCAVQKKKDVPMNLGKGTDDENSSTVNDEPVVNTSEENTNENACITENTNDQKTQNEIQKTEQNRPKKTPKPGKIVKKNKIWWQSVIVPGLAQIRKGGVAEGVATLAGEAVLLGCGVFSHYHSQKQLDNMRNTQIPSEFNAARKAYNTDKVINLSCYAGAAVLYAFNLFRAYTLDSHPSYYAVTPKVMSLDGELAMGLSFTYNF